MFKFTQVLTNVNLSVIDFRSCNLYSLVYFLSTEHTDEVTLLILLRLLHLVDALIQNKSYKSALESRSKTHPHANSLGQ